jgi:hypothetical protein
MVIRAHPDHFTAPAAIRFAAADHLNGVTFFNLDRHGTHSLKHFRG